MKQDAALRTEVMKYRERYLRQKQVYRVLIPMSHSLKNRMAVHCAANEYTKSDLIRMSVKFDLQYRVLSAVRSESDMKARILVCLDNAIKDDIQIRLAGINFTDSESLSAYVRECLYQFLDQFQEENHEKK